MSRTLAQEQTATDLTDHEIRWSFTLPDERLAELPLVSCHDHPQIAPQEYECGCVTIVRVTDRDYRRHERPFEMRLARRCSTDACEVEAELEETRDANVWRPL